MEFSIEIKLCVISAPQKLEATISLHQGGEIYTYKHIINQHTFDSGKYKKIKKILAQRLSQENIETPFPNPS